MEWTGYPIHKCGVRAPFTGDEGEQRPIASVDLGVDLAAGLHHVQSWPVHLCKIRGTVNELRVIATAMAVCRSATSSRCG